MGMGKKQVAMQAVFFHHAVAETADPGPGVHNNGFTVAAANFQAGGISAVTQVLCAGNRYRSP
jgi:hypothetical protein